MSRGSKTWRYRCPICHWTRNGRPNLLWCPDCGAELTVIFPRSADKARRHA